MCKSLIFTLLLVISGSLTANVNAASPATKLVDPTRPLGYRADGKKKQSLKLQAIFYGEGRREAIVSGVAVREGDVVRGKRILKIHANTVIYESAGRHHTLALRPSIFK